MEKAKETLHKVAHPTDKQYDERDLNPKPTKTHIPSSDSDSSLSVYRPAGKLAGKRAVIAGGDSGIGRTVAILFAMEALGGIDILVNIAATTNEHGEITDITEYSMPN
ncbi:hypothetical protein M426DRAFT_14443 [Hypoxylon sp. CI-4A]|nr:hypothetical protein M426DRAFT_14443 [Hypoxylon sp. CI-4A]